MYLSGRVLVLLLPEATVERKLIYSLLMRDFTQPNIVSLNKDKLSPKVSTAHYLA